MSTKAALVLSIETLAQSLSPEDKLKLFHRMVQDHIENANSLNEWHECCAISKELHEDFPDTFVHVIATAVLEIHSRLLDEEGLSWEIYQTKAMINLHNIHQEAKELLNETQKTGSANRETHKSSDKPCRKD